MARPGLLVRVSPFFRPLKGPVPMRMLSLAAFAVLALVIGGYEEDAMTLLIGVASAVGAFASQPRWKLSTFLTLLSDLFAIETILFGLADIVALLGYWPEPTRNIRFPLSAARDGALRRRHLRYLPFSLRAQNDDDHRSVFRAQTPSRFGPGPCRPSRCGRTLRAHQHLLPYSHQSVSGRARRSAQLFLSRFRQRHPDP